jgi:hypothetical protein
MQFGVATADDVKGILFGVRSWASSSRRQWWWLAVWLLVGESVST